MKKLPLIVLLLSLLGFGSGIPEAPFEDHVPGQFIVQLKTSGTDGLSQATQVFEESFQGSGMKVVKVLSERMGISLFEFDNKSVSELQLLNEVKRHDLVHQAQYNHYIELRETEPDDPSFPDQWALKNTGQLNGVVDADIDATDAWDITTGGISSLGDTIIIAIIDDGFNLGHDDIDFWENYHEIPMNGIDDDNNGFVDDYRGWNAYTSTGTIISKDHGTHVAGIAGAIGNNGLGVTGINWDAKILPVLGSSTTESIVVEAYGYVYAQRAKYNETNGALGAYIVVSNCSFGVNYGQPENYPVWGSMYDSLGQIGVLSSGATANMNINVDEVGDIPTAFESDYLITVTNTDMKDEKYLASGWGPVSIDLGAPGKNIYSTRQGNTYGYKTGTSMSAPHISGSIALMYAAAEPAFLESYHNNLATVSLLLKHYMLQSTEEIPSLVDSTVSGGRLNVNNAIELLLTPVLESNADSLKVSLLQDSIDAVSFELICIADLELGYEATIYPGTDWLSLEPSSGIIPANGSVGLKATFNAVGLDPGIYLSGIEAMNIRGDKVLIEVEMTVLEPAGVLEESVLEGSIKVYPNPCTDVTRLRYLIHDIRSLGSARDRHLTCDLYSISGRKIRIIMEEEKLPGEHEIEVDVSDLLPGVYFIRVQAGADVSVSKIVKIE